MARKALIIKANKEPKFAVRKVNRCFNCGRVRAVFRQFSLCRLCLCLFISQGYLPG